MVGILGISKNGYVRYFIKGVTASKIAIEGNKFLIYPMYEGKIYSMLGKELVKYPSNSHHDTIQANGEEMMRLQRLTFLEI